MLHIKQIFSNDNVAEVIFTADSESDAKTMKDLFICYVANAFHCIPDFDNLKIPVGKETAWFCDFKNDICELK